MRRHLLAQIYEKTVNNNGLVYVRKGHEQMCLCVFHRALLGSRFHVASQGCVFGARMQDKNALSITIYSAVIM